MQFPLGRPILVLLFAALISGAAILQRPVTHRADLNIWCFFEPHANEYRDAMIRAGEPVVPSLVDQFQRRAGRSVDIQLLGQSALDVRMLSLFMSGASGRRLPDLFEIEIHSVGQYLRPPVADIGLYPLNHFLERSGWGSRLIASRLETMSKINPETGERLFFGIPDDIHPVTITYRKDLFEGAGLDPQRCKTWAEFQACCLKLQEFQHGQGVLALGLQSPDELMMMLLQRHINLVDELNRPHFTDPEVLDTALFYTQLVAGPEAISAEPSPGVNWTNDLRIGAIAAVLTPDWKAAQIPPYAPELAGKLRMMELPTFEAWDAPTSTLGGTFICVPRNCRDPELAWRMLEFFYLSPDAIAARVGSGSSVLAASPDLWKNPAYHEADCFYAGSPGSAGQRIDELYMSLAPEIPRRAVTPYSFAAELAMTEVLRRCVDYARSRASVDGLRPLCQGWLADAQVDLDARIRFGEQNR